MLRERASRKMPLNQHCATKDLALTESPLSTNHDGSLGREQEPIVKSGASNSPRNRANEERIPLGHEVDAVGRLTRNPSESWAIENAILRENVGERARPSLL
jgi:hypothetical protein